MAMVGVDSGSLQRTRSTSRFAWSEGRRPLKAIPHSPNEPGELSQWFCHDDSTINIGICIIIIIIIIIIICLRRIVSLHFTNVTILANQRPVNDVTTR